MTGARVGMDGGPADGRTSTSDADPIAWVVFALLVVACLAAFFVTQRLKHTPTVVQRFELSPSFSPSSPAPENLEQISFKLAKADQVTVAIEASNGEVVATLVHDRPVVGYKQFSLRWNGRRGTARRFGQLKTPHGRSILVALNEGALAPPGEYRVLVELRRQGRVVLSPRSFKLVGP